MTLAIYDAYSVPNALRSSPTMSAANYGKKVAASGRDITFLTVGDLYVKPSVEQLQSWCAQLEADAKQHPDKVYLKTVPARDTYKYADTLGAVGLRAAIAHCFIRDTGIDGVTEQHVAVGTGAKGALNGVCSVLASGDSVILASPGWPTNFDMFPAGVRVIEVDTEGRGLIAPEQLRRVLRAKPEAKAILINAPSNPTGANYSKEERIELMQVLQQEVVDREFLILLDDPYGKLVFDGQTLQRGDAEKALFNAGKIAVLRSMSKEYGLAGARIGYVVSKSPDVIEMVKRWNESKGGGISGPEQTTAHAALLYGDAFIASTIEDLRSKRAVLMQAVKALRYATMQEPRGTIYGWINFSALKDKTIPAGHTLAGAELTISTPEEMMVYLVEVAGVQGVGGTPFYAPGSPLALSDWHVRMTFCGDKAELEKAGAKLKRAEEVLK
jgi:aspartate aminotransferase